MLRDVTLQDKFGLEEGRVMISGTQALSRILIDQRRSDARHGLRTAGFISGYRGSPLGSLDSALWAAQRQLDEHGIVFKPGVNEELAATAIYGTQQVGFFPGARHDGVFAAWYGKGPGVDRAGDALKHGNFAGTSAAGGVLVYAGDDHAAKSSTTSHQSEQALVAALIPVLYPASVADFLEYGSFGFALSRYSGLWAGFKCVNDTADATAVVDLMDPARTWALPEEFERPPEGLNIIRGETPLSMERRTVDFRLPAAQAFVRRNRLDRVLRDSPRRTLGIVTAGKAALDVMSALNALGLDERRSEALGIRVLKLAMTWPVEPLAMREFCAGHRQVLVVEEKRAFIEPQVATILFHEPADRRPQLIGKVDASGRPLLLQVNELNPPLIQEALMRVLEELGLVDEPLRACYAELSQRMQDIAGPATEFARMPFFCSGCPHNSSTKVPEGSIALSGIGCHAMAAFMPHRPHLWPVQMGGEGTNWIGIAPFTDQQHVFQNLGDGTYYHSGFLAIRASIAAGVSITYKLLYNDAVAMTGGQPIEGQLAPWQMASELLQEGAKKIVIVADDVGRYEGAPVPSGVAVRPRGELELVQRELRETNGVTVIIYDQVCAAEKRRRGKRAAQPAPFKRAFINDLVCEACGDCSVKSNCVSVQPLETEFGRKRVIDQSSCNTDFSCVEGFCPSFVTVKGGSLRKRKAGSALDLSNLTIPNPPPAVDEDRAVLILGIGGTGVVTIGAILCMAANLEGKAGGVIDQTGLSQKNGAVSSHLRIVSDPSRLSAARISCGEADLLLGCDMITAGGGEAMSLLRPGSTVGIVNQNLTATAAFTINNSIDFQGNRILERLKAVLEPGRSLFIDATRVTTQLLGDSIGTNMFIVGAALQRGLLPVSLEAVERAISLNGVAVDFNLQALRLGRLAVSDPTAFQSLLGREEESRAPACTRLSSSIEELVARRVAFLRDYQNEDYARRYEQCVEDVRAAEARAMPSSTLLAETVARNLFKLMAYKDEYEVGRLYTSGEFEAKLKEQFAGDYKLSFHLAPPLLARRDPVTGHPRKKAFGSYMLPMFRLLAKAKVLRGTPFDPFGYTAERRTERRLIEEYVELVSGILADLDAANHDRAVKLAAYPDSIRGFGHIKARNLAAAMREREESLAAFQNPAVRELEAAE